MSLEGSKIIVEEPVKPGSIVQVEGTNYQIGQLLASNKSSEMTTYEAETPQGEKIVVKGRPKKHAKYFHQADNSRNKIPLSSAILSRYLGFYEGEEHYYAITNYIEGGVLKEVYRSQEFGAEFSTQRVKNVRKVIRELIHIAGIMSAQGVVYRDFYPGNVVLKPKWHCEESETQTPDWGILGEVGVIDIDWITSIGSEEAKKIRGQPYIVAPEVVRGEGVTISTDIYSIGITALMLLEKEISDRIFRFFKGLKPREIFEHKKNNTFLESNRLPRIFREYLNAKTSSYPETSHRDLAKTFAFIVCATLDKWEDRAQNTVEALGILDAA